MDEQTNGQEPVSRRDIIFIFQAYNRGEFDYDELIRRTRTWAEAMLQRQPAADLCKTPEPSPR
jgi:hypothetical protein